MYKHFTLLTLIFLIFSNSSPIKAQINNGTFECEWGVYASDRCHLKVDTEQCSNAPGFGSPEDNWCATFTTEEECQGKNNACNPTAGICWTPDDFNANRCKRIPSNPDGSCPNGSFAYEIECNRMLQPTSSIATPTPLPITPLPTAPPYPPFNPCTFSSEAGNCNDCVDNKGVWTALGCIPSNSNELIVGLIKFAMGMAGGIAFLIMLYGTFVIITASGNPEKVAGGQQTITAAVMGLLTIIFAAVILNIIGVQIIQIPGF